MRQPQNTKPSENSLLLFLTADGFKPSLVNLALKGLTL